MAWWESLLFPVGSGSVLQPIMGSNSWTNGLLDMLILPNRSGFPPARNGSSSWTNGLLDRLVLPNLGTVESSSPQWVQQLDQWRPMACWTSLFFPVGSGLVLQPAMGPAAGPMACPLWVQQLDQWHAGQACSSQWERLSFSSPLWVQQLATGLLDKRVPH